MKKVIIDGKEYFQQEECDIPKISMTYPKDLLTKYQPERLSPEDSNLHSEFGCSFPLRFNTCEGIKIMEPGKVYDRNLNEI